MWIIWLGPMNLAAMNSPAAWASDPAWLAQASLRIHGVKLRSKASTAVLRTQMSVSMEHDARGTIGRPSNRRNHLC